MSSALVTGATGFIGGHLCHELVSQGWTVAGTYRGNSGSPSSPAGVSWTAADVLDADAVREAVAGHDHVFHLAGIGLLDASAETVRQVNVEGTRNVLEACRAEDVDRVVFTSTAGTRRSRNGPAVESDVAEPVSAYQRSKARAEELVGDYVAGGHEAVTVHPTSVFGPGDPTFTARVLGLVTDPKMAIYPPGGVSVVGVRDVARGIKAAMVDGESGENYILGGENLSYGTLLETLAHMTDGTAPRFRVPPAAIHAAGPVVGVLNDMLGTRMFPVDAEMSRLVTQELYYSSGKAASDFDYTFRPVRAHATAAVEWYLGAADSV